MNKFKYYFILLITTISLFSCSKNKTDENIVVTPPRDYAEQYKTDMENIEEYLKKNYITVVDNAGMPNDQDVTITKIPDGGTQPSIYSYLNNTTFPKLLTRNVKIHDITYKLYYLALRGKVDENVSTDIEKAPTNVDELFIAYKGVYLERKIIETVSTLSTTQFEEHNYPIWTSNFENYIRGWKEILPQFMKGTYTPNNNGTISFNDFGAGIMFIPSGLAYFNNPQGTIPAYSPLIFSFKLMEFQRLDNEGSGTRGAINFVPTPDGIMSFQEDLDGDRYMWRKDELPTGAVNPDDSDKDGIPDFLDIDDDGDNYTTKFEIKNPATGLPFPFTDIPTCASGKKNYLDATCHP